VEWLRPGIHLSSVNRTEFAPPVFEKVTRPSSMPAKAAGKFHRAQFPAIGGFNQGDRNSHSGVADFQGAGAEGYARAGIRAESDGEITCFHNYQALACNSRRRGHRLSRSVK
jgi:hypothetical protein